MKTNPEAVHQDALRSEIRQAIINQKVNACPIMIRLAWHASGTYKKEDGSGGSNGATMRFEPESTDGANAGLSIARDLLEGVKDNHPEVSYADLWTFAGTCALEFAGGPRVPFDFCRQDKGPEACPPNGRLPDATQDASHLRDVFYRMGFNDQEIVCLSGAHTLGSCHESRSGFDGPWTKNPLKFDNQFFRNLLMLEWKPRDWKGNFQFSDPSGQLMMLPTDMALKTDPEFRPWVELYAKDEKRFFDDFSDAFAKLLALGTNPPPRKQVSSQEKASYEFREAAMHGRFKHLKDWVAQGADVHAVEPSTGRSALHKAAFWGHTHIIDYLLNELKLDPNVRDSKGDTPLHDAARFGHDAVVEILLKGGADKTITNNQGQNPKQGARKQSVISKL